MTDKLTIESVFPVNVYTIDKPEFLKIGRTVTLELIENRKKQVELNEAFPSYMTDAVNADPRMLDFANYVAQTAWNILQMQGYEVTNMTTYFESMWGQEHHKNSLMEQHVHGNGNQIVGFYFLDVPEDSSRVVFYDPKPSKVQINLPETNNSLSTPASNMINYHPKEGMLMLTNAWLPHSFTRNMSDKPMRFIHFNVNVKEATTYYQPPMAEVI
jgi:uncharacterized protein (TIGR02466 family)